MTAIATQDKDLASVMKNDGVAKANTHGSINRIFNRLEDIKKEMGEPSWSVRLIYTDMMSAVMICQKPGESNRTHYHANEDEWWVIMEGELEWDVDGYGTYRAKKDDIVFVPRKVIHNIRVVGDQPSIRLAIGKPDVNHIFVEDHVFAKN